MKNNRAVSAPLIQQQHITHHSPKKNKENRSLSSSQKLHFLLEKIIII